MKGACLITMICILSIILISGCISGNRTQNTFKDFESGNKTAHVMAGYITVLDSISTECVAKTGWKFVKIGVSIANYRNDDSITFAPRGLIDTDDLHYLYNEEACYSKMDTGYGNGTIAPGGYSSFTITFEVPMTSVPNKLDYYLFGAGMSDSPHSLWNRLYLK
jgi:hypothetical protein